MCRCCHAAARGLGSDGLDRCGIPALTVDQAAVGAAVTGVTCRAVHLVSHVPRMSHPLRVLWQQAYTSRCPSSLVCLEHLVSLFRTTVNARVALSKFSVTPASLRVRGSAAVACTVNLGRASETPPSPRLSTLLGEGRHSDTTR